MSDEDYVRDYPHWGNWYLSAARAPGALYNVDNAYAEFGLDDLMSVSDLAKRIKHFVEKSWCDDDETCLLCDALRDTIGLRIRVEYDHGSKRGDLSFVAWSGLPEPKVFIGDARNAPILRTLYQRLRHTFPPPKSPEGSASPAG